MRLKTTRQYLQIFVYFLTGSVCYGQNTFDQMNVGSIPQVFCPEALSTDAPEWNNWFAKNETEIYYTVQSTSSSYIVKRTIKGCALGEEEIIDFDLHQSYSNPWVNESGDHIIFQASFPYNEGERNDSNIWESKLVGTEWSTPKIYSSSTAKNKSNEGSPVMTKSGSLYFNASKSSSSNADIYVLPKDKKEAKPLPKTINSQHFEGDFYVDQDERFIIFSSFDRNNGLGQSDLYISFRKGNEWTEAKSLGAKINSEGQDFSPYVSSDGNYLIFTSSRNSFRSLRPSFNHYIVKINIEDYK